MGTVASVFVLSPNPLRVTRSVIYVAGGELILFPVSFLANEELSFELPEDRIKPLLNLSSDSVCTPSSSLFIPSCLVLVELLILVWVPLRSINLLVVPTNKNKNRKEKEKT